ncbi:MAG: VIT domain-containing protein [Polyangiaceae bacterium]
MSPRLPRVSSHLVEDTATLPLESARLEIDASAGLARVRLVQRFVNRHSEPLSVTYKLPLPHDAAVGGFAFRLGERRIVGKIQGKNEARETYERAIVEGRSAALLEQERSSLFTQEIGNIPPMTAVEAEIDIDQRLIWSSEGAWELRFPLTNAPRYLGGPEHDVPGDVTITAAEGGIAARASLTMSIRDAIDASRSPESPSHPLVCVRAKDGFSVELGAGNRCELDRDIVVRWPVAELTARVSLDVARPAADAPRADSSFGLLTIVPPKPEAKAKRASRDLTLLLDTSGSMSGAPLEQEKRIACALIDTLGDDDQLEIIEFADAPRAFKSGPARATKDLRRDAIKWVKKLVASGGTEMVSGVREAMRTLRAGSQRQVVLITDGLVGFERQIVTTLLASLPASARFHAVGVGSAVNRSLVAPLARAGRGIEVIVGLGEDPERAAARLTAATDAPVLLDVVVEGPAVKRVVPERLSAVHAGAPMLVGVELDPAGGEVVVRGRTADGAFVRHVRVAPVERGEGRSAVTKLFARELVEDLEMKLSAGEAASSIDRQIEEAGRSFAIATRLTSWVAVSEEITVDPNGPSRKTTQPNALPFGVDAVGVGLRPAAPGNAPMLGGFMPAQPVLSAAPAPASEAIFEAERDAGAGFGFAPPAMGVAGPRTGAPPPSASLPPSMAPLPAAPMRSRGFIAPQPKSESKKLGGAGGEPSPPNKVAREEAAPRDERSKEKARKMDAADDRARADESVSRGPSAPAPESAAEGFFGRVSRRMKELFSSDEPVERVEQEEAKPAEPERAATLRGRLVATEKGLVMVEITVSDGVFELAYDGAEAELTLDDGRVVKATIRLERSTRAGLYGDGLTVRIALTLEQGAHARSARLRFASGISLSAS